MDLDRFEELLGREVEGTLGDPEREELDGACQADSDLALLRARDQKLQNVLDFEQTGKAPEALLASVMSEIVDATAVEDESAVEAETAQPSAQDDRVVSIEEVKAPWWSNLLSSRIPQFALGSAIAAVFLFQIAYIAMRHGSPGGDPRSNLNIADAGDSKTPEDSSYEIASTVPGEEATAKETPSDLAATKSPIRQPGDRPLPRSTGEIALAAPRISALPRSMSPSGATGLVRVDNGTSPTNGRTVRVATPTASQPNAALVLERVTANVAQPLAVIEVNLASIVDGGRTSGRTASPALDSPTRTGFQDGFNTGRRNPRARALRGAIRSLELRLASFGNIRRVPVVATDPESQSLVLSIPKSHIPSLLKELESDGLRPADVESEPDGPSQRVPAADAPLAGGLYRILRGDLPEAATTPEEASHAEELIEIQFVIRTRR